MNKLGLYYGVSYLIIICQTLQNNVLIICGRDQGKFVGFKSYQDKEKRSDTEVRRTFMYDWLIKMNIYFSQISLLYPCIFY